MKTALALALLLVACQPKVAPESQPRGKGGVIVVPPTDTGAPLTCPPGQVRVKQTCVSQTYIPPPAPTPGGNVPPPTPQPPPLSGTRWTVCVPANAQRPATSASDHWTFLLIFERENSSRPDTLTVFGRLDGVESQAGTVNVGAGVSRAFMPLTIARNAFADFSARGAGASDWKWRGDVVQVLEQPQ